MTFPPDSLLAKTNKWLICLYVLSCGLGLTSCIFFALVWSHWHSTLNSCYASDCGCVLYVMTTLNVIAGGNIWICYFVTYTHLLVGLASCGLACYYCVRSLREETRRSRVHGANRRFVPVPSYDGGVIPGQAGDSCFTPLALSSGVISVLLLSTAYLYTEGYYKTCSEYRRTVARNLKASGNLVSLIFDRLSCTSILDLMDYTQPNTPRRDPRGGIINSSFLLQGAIVTAWAHFLVWALLLVYNAMLARRNSLREIHGKIGVIEPKDRIGKEPKGEIERETKGVIGMEPNSIMGTETAI
ncbi:hypothetical protein M8J77_005988 [Diaphorina citri]|nr:hypothetical protein M8J77_005988 [Diaphorina citri]